jgi:hypothetical protein
MRSFLLFASLVGLVLSDEACYNHVTVRMYPGSYVIWYQVYIDDH